MIAFVKLFFAIGSIHGAVTDSAARPIAGVEVTIPDLGRRTTTRSDGRYSFAGLPHGDFTLVFRRLGFTPVTRRVQIQDADVELNVTLRPAAVELEPLTITGTRTAADPLASPLPTASLDRDGVSARPGVSLAHALADIPGIRALTTGGETRKPVIRGLSGPRVLVLDDGRRLEDYSWSDEDGPSTDPRLADRVEVIRGPASVLYGSDALGGVDNVISEDVPDGKGPLRTRIAAYGASNNGELGTSVHMERGSDAVGWLVGVAGRRAEALHTPAGELENTGFNAISGEAAGGTSGTWGKLSGRFTHYGGEFKLLEADTGALPPPPPPGGVEEGPVRKLSDDRVQFDGTFPAGGLRLETKGQWQRHWLAEVVEGDTASTEKGFDLVLNTLSVDLFAHHGSSQVTGTFGASAFHQTNATRGDETLVPT